MRIVHRRLVLLAGLSAAVLASCAMTPGGSASSTGRFAFIGTDGLLYTASADGSNVAAMTPNVSVDGRRIENWPTWSPNGKWLAFMRLVANGQAVTSAGVFVVGSDGRREIALPVPDGAAPIYMTWSPDSRYLTMLLQQGDGLTLYLADMQHDPPAVRQLEAGAPLFTSWSPDSSTLVIHVDGDARQLARARLTRVDVGAGGPAEALPLQPGAFATPAWAPDGSGWAFAAAVADAEDGVYVRRGDRSDLLARGATPAFVWAPAGSSLAVATRKEPADDFYAGLAIVDGTGSATKILSDPVLAFFWSPDGKRLVYFTPGVDGLTLVSTDAAGKDKHELATFSPTQDYAQLLNFFDQYAQSHAIWSPDSRQVLFAGIRTSGNGASNPNQPHVYAAQADGSGVKSLADGRLGFWAPAPR